WEVVPPGNEIQFSSVSSDGKILVSAGVKFPEEGKCRMRQWGLKSHRELSVSREIGNLPQAFSPNGKTAAAEIGPNHQIRLLGTATGKELWSIPVDNLTDAVDPVFSPDGELLVTTNSRGKGDEAGSFILWEAATGKKLLTTSLPEGQVHRLFFSPG